MGLLYLYFYHDILKSSKILSLDRNVCQFYPIRVFRNVYPISYPPIAMSTFYVADFRGNFLPKILIRIGLNDLHNFNRKTITSRLLRFLYPQTAEQTGRIENSYIQDRVLPISGREERKRQLKTKEKMD
jgi:hypothetical protein